MACQSTGAARSQQCPQAVKLAWTRRAAADRRAIRSYIARANLRAAIALDELFGLKARVLIEQPRLGRAGRIQGTRELVVHRHYVLIYDIADDTVRVLRVLHTARQWPLLGPGSA